MAWPEMEDVLTFFSRIAGAEMGGEVTLAEMKRVWLDYLRWVYKLTDYSGATHLEVQRLRKDAASKAELAEAFNRRVALSPLSLGGALAV